MSLGVFFVWFGFGGFFVVWLVGWGFLGWSVGWLVGLLFLFLFFSFFSEKGFVSEVR